MGKIKIGTQIEETVYQQLKIAAARERRPVGELLQEAVSVYLTRPRKTAFISILTRQPTFRVSDEEHREIMAADFFDQ